MAFPTTAGCLVSIQADITWLERRGRLSEELDHGDSHGGRSGAVPDRRAGAAGPAAVEPVALAHVKKYPRRTVLGIAMIMSQAFLYNGVSFTFALVLTTFYGVAADRVGLFLMPFALGNFLGPLVLGRLFDTVGRKPMIAGTYAISAVGLVVTGFLFNRGVLGTTTQTLAWGVIFFFAAAAASSAYLTVSEIFPLEMRGLAIALFFSTGTAPGGPIASWLFGRLIDQRQRVYVLYGDLLAAAILIGAAGIVLVVGVKAQPTRLRTRPSRFRR